MKITHPISTSFLLLCFAYISCNNILLKDKINQKPCFIDGKYTLCADSTNVKIEQKKIKQYYKGNWTFKNGIAKQVKDSLFKFNLKNNLQVEFQYDSLLVLDDGFIQVKKTNGLWGVFSPIGRQIIPFKYFSPVLKNNIDKHFGYSRVGINGKYGLLDKKKKKAIPAKYNDLKPLNKDGFAIAKLDSLWGALDKNGKEIIPFDYEYLGYNLGFFYAKKNKKYGVLDKKGSIIIPFEYERIHFFNEELGLARAIKDDLYGAINKKNQTVIPFKYKYVDYFRMGYAKVRRMNNWSIFDVSTNTLTPLGCSKIYPLKNNNFAAKYNKWCIVDSIGNEITPQEYDNIKKLGDKYLAVTVNDIMGVIDLNGNNVLDIKYDNIFSFKENLFVVQLKEKHGVLDEEGNIIIPFEYTKIRIKDGVIISTKNKKSHVFNILGNKVTELSFDKIDLNRSKKQDRFLVKKEGKWGLVRKDWSILIEIKHDSIIRFGDLYKIKFDNRWGVLSLEGKLIIPYEHDDVRIINNNFISLKKDNKWALFSIKSKKLWSDYIFDNIWVDDELIIASIDGKYGILDFKGNILLPFEHDYMYSISKGKYFDQKNGKLFIRNKNGFSINPQPYRILRNFSTPLYFGFIEKEGGNLLIDSNFNILSENIYYDGHGSKFNNNTIAVGKGKSYSTVFDSLGNIIIPPKYSSIYYLDTNLLRVSLAGKYGVINSNLEEVVPLEYSEVRLLSPNKFLVNQWNKYGFVDTTGFFIPGDYDYLYKINSNLFRVSKNNLSGLINKKGEEITSIKYRGLSTNKGVNIGQIENGKYHLFDNSGKILLEFDNYMYRTEYFIIQIGKKWGIFDKQGNRLSLLKYDSFYSSSFIQGWDKESQAKDRAYKKKFNVDFFWTFNNNDNCERFIIDGKTGILEISGNEVREIFD